MQNILLHKIGSGHPPPRLEIPYWVIKICDTQHSEKKQLRKIVLQNILLWSDSAIGDNENKHLFTYVH